jgi:hypothetical protein
MVKGTSVPELIWTEPRRSPLVAKYRGSTAIVNLAGLAALVWPALGETNIHGLKLLARKLMGAVEFVDNVGAMFAAPTTELPFDWKSARLSDKVRLGAASSSRKGRKAGYAFEKRP